MEQTSGQDQTAVQRRTAPHRLMSGKDLRVRDGRFMDVDFHVTVATLGGSLLLGMRYTA